MARHALPVPLKKPQGGLARLLRRKPKGYRTILLGDMVRHDDLKLGRGLVTGFAFADADLGARVEWISGAAGVYPVQHLRRSGVLS